MLSDRRLLWLPLVGPPDLQTAASECTQHDIALVDLVQEAQTAAAVAEHQLSEGTSP
jgi:hypothetical protein